MIQMIKSVLLIPLLIFYLVFGGCLQSFVELILFLMQIYASYMRPFFDRFHIKNVYIKNGII